LALGLFDTVLRNDNDTVFFIATMFQHHKIKYYKRDKNNHFTHIPEKKTASKFLEAALN